MSQIICGPNKQTAPITINTSQVAAEHSASDPTLSPTDESGQCSSPTIDLVRVYYQQQGTLSPVGSNFCTIQHSCPSKQRPIRSLSRPTDGYNAMNSPAGSWWQAKGTHVVGDRHFCWTRRHNKLIKLIDHRSLLATKWPFLDVTTVIPYRLITEAK